MRLSLVVLALFTGVLFAQEPARPWMQGNVEMYCHQTQEDIERMQREFPDKADRIKLCACKSVCDPSYEHAQETEGRRWTTPCEARCSPSNCNCKSPCDS